MILVSLGLVSPARADSVNLSDPDDSPGGFDMVEVRHAHFTIQATGQVLLRHRIRTAEAWSFKDLGYGGYFEILFSFDGDRAPERRLTVGVEDDGTPYAVMDDGPDWHIRGYAKVWKPRPKVLIVEFPRRLLADDLESYSWYAFSVFHEDDHPQCGTVDDMVFLCGDRAPNRGWLHHGGRH